MAEVKISIAEAKPDKLQYVVANFAIIDPQKRAVLLLRRSQKEKVHGGKWAFPGGKLEHSNIAEMIAEEGADPLEGVEDVLGKLATRETKEESGIEVTGRNDVIIKNKIFVRPDGVPVFMVTLAAEYQSGAVVLEKGFVDYTWAKIDELDGYDCIPGIKQEARKALELFA